MDTSRSYDIVGGPSLDRIFDSFKYTQQRRAFVGVWFKIIEPSFRHPQQQPVPVNIENVVINSIRCHDDDNDVATFDDSGADSSVADTAVPWYEIGGRCWSYSDGSKSGNYQRYRFNAYYNPKTRKGYISFYEL